MKSKRQEQVLSIIAQKDIHTQQELVAELQALGYEATQATVARDIRDLQLIKEPLEGGGFRYREPDVPAPVHVSERMIRILSDSVQSADSAGNLVVVRTMNGTANAAAEVLDALNWPELLGTIAGDNTILAVVKREEDAGTVVGRIRRLAGR